MPVLDATFNVIVADFAPKNVLYTSTQYADFAEMAADYRATGFLKINTEHSDGTIFGSPVTNWQFRAWHDLCHIQAGADFSADGERAAGELQKSQVRARYGNTTDTARWCAIIDAEVNGQTEFYIENGDFPTDQYAFVVAYLAARYGLNLPIDGRGWAGGFATTRVADRRAAEIAPAVFAAAAESYQHSNAPVYKAEMVRAGMAAAGASRAA